MAMLQDTATLRQPTGPNCGMVTTREHLCKNSSDKPFPSCPTMRAGRSGKQNDGSRTGSSEISIATGAKRSAWHQSKRESSSGREIMLQIFSHLSEKAQVA